MLESLTIFTAGGLILYQYNASPSLVMGSAAAEQAAGGSTGACASDPVQLTRKCVSDHVIAKVLLDPSSSASKSHHINGGLSYCWLTPDQTRDGAAGSSASRASSSIPQYYIIAMYPDILFEGPRQYLRAWAANLLQQTTKEYNIFLHGMEQKKSFTTLAEQQKGGGESQSPDVVSYWIVQSNSKAFDPTFHLLLQQSKSQRPAMPAANSSTTTSTSTSTTANEKTASTNASTKRKTGKEKQKRNWYDGEAKVTDKAMAQLDMSKEQTNTNTTTGGGSDGTSSEPITEEMKMQRALQEARQAYLPDSLEVQDYQTHVLNDNDTSTSTSTSSTSTSTSSSWSSNVTGIFQQITGNKVLSDTDLNGPLNQMEQLLTRKNVSTDMARDVCMACRMKLRGKRLNSLYSVQTAIQQALESSLTKILHNNNNNNDVDLLRNVMRKRGDGSSFFGINNSTSTSSSNKKPYVIMVMGINGIGKTTSLAKLAFYFSQQGCKPLLVAGDTFRSGAVEQLKIHAQCLNLPMYGQGYSKDPSSVARAAIQQATEQGNDVVLIDTAGRMQNNLPLMKALGKLVQENQPDFILFVCEALVGHDGLDQYKMFQQALGVNRRVDGLLLTKFDTVSDKVGAALTLTHETGAPIVFCGTGQKYHHLQKLKVKTVLQSLFSK